MRPKPNAGTPIDGLLGFAGVGVCAAFAFVTGRAKDFYLPGIWMYLALAIAFTTSLPRTS